MVSDSAGPLTSLAFRIGAILKNVRMEADHRRRATEKTMREVEGRLKHIAFLIASLNLRLVVPKLAELASMFPHANPPKREGVCDRISIDFLPTDEYPAQARVCVGMTPLPSAERLRVTFTVVMLPVHLPYQREAWIDVVVQNPDLAALADFLDGRIMQFVSDYVRVRDPESPYHDEQKVTDPVCKMTFSMVEAATSAEWNGQTYYFCVESCARRFQAAPERYVERPVAVKDLPSHERPPLLDMTPGESPPARPGSRAQTGG